MNILLGTLATLLMFWSAAQPQDGHGSLLVWIVSQRGDYVVIGAESRTAKPDGSFLDDSSCKIISLDGHTLFYGSGTEKVIPKRGSSWNSNRTARAVFATTGNHDAASLVNAWGNKALQWFGQYSEKDLMSVANPERGLIAVGGFVNFDKNGSLSIIQREILLDLAKHKLGSQPSSTDFGQVGAAGVALPLVQEFFPGNTERAVRAFGPIGALRLVGADADKDSDLVERSIKFAMDNASEEEKRVIGGDIDIAIIRKDGKIRWVERKTRCGEEDLKNAVRH